MPPHAEIAAWITAFRFAAPRVVSSDALRSPLLNLAKSMNPIGAGDRLQEIRECAELWVFQVVAIPLGYDVYAKEALP